jgi:uncharacterized protein (DUF305 family)
MDKKRSITIVAIIAVVVVAGVSIYVINKKDNSTTNSENSSSQSVIGMVDKNSADYKTYSKLNGEDYDHMFIANMIAHHQGAVEMANLALTNAKHPELKDMANAIITAQTKEIKDMQGWQMTWGYPASSGGAMEDHSSMGTMNEMANMSDGLEGLYGDAFDKAFLTSMMAHHQSAINMAYPGQTNAKHDEVKKMTKDIITAQSKEIATMQSWQKQWGYEQDEASSHDMNMMNH